MEKNIPEKKFKAGAITAVVWKNKGNINGKETEYHTVSVERNYKGKDNNWQKTTSLRVNDIPNARLVLSKVFEQIQLRDVTSNGSSGSTDVDVEQVI